MRHAPPLVVATLLTLTFSSCTCSNATPDVPPATPAPRRGSFDMLKKHDRPAPERGAITPGAVEARPAPTLPTAATEAKLPEDFPSDVPVFEGAKLSGVSEIPSKGHAVVFTVDESEAGKVFDFYKGDMVRNGWKADQESQGKDNSFLSFKKGGTVTYIQITKDNSGKRVVAVMYFHEEPLAFPEF